MKYFFVLREKKIIYLIKIIKDGFLQKYYQDMYIEDIIMLLRL